jgi:hypothetical protein
LKFLIDMPVTPQAVRHLLALLGSEGPGVILFRGGSYSDDAMLALLDRVLAQGHDLEGSITVVDRHRIRQRHLPLKD